MATYTVAPAPAPASMDLPLFVQLRYPTTRLEYVDSFGPEAFHRQDRFGHFLRCDVIGWWAQGLAAERWERLQGSLRSFIREKRPLWVAKRPRGEPRHCVGNDLPYYTLHCFLLGPDQGHACPSVAVVSAEKWFREIVGVHLIKSNLLSPDGFKCFALAEGITAPAGSASGSSAVPGKNTDLSKQLEDMQGQSSIARSRIQAFGLDTEDRPVGWNVKGDMNFLKPYVALGQPQDTGHQTKEASAAGECRVVERKHMSWDGINFNGIGVEIRTWDRVTGEAIIGEATMGGVIRLEGDVYAMTVGHAFDLSDPITEWFEAAEDDQGESDECIVFFDGTLKDDPGETTTESPEDEAQGFSEGLTQAAQSSSAPRAKTSHPEFVGPGVGGLDWMLKQAPTEAKNRPFALVDSQKADNDVIIKTPSENKQASLVSTAILGIPSNPTPHSVLVAHLNVSQLQMGDCGSWAMRAANGTFPGMVVASCPNLGVAYLLEMESIFEDIHRQTGFRPSLDFPSTPKHRDEFLSNTGGLTAADTIAEFDRMFGG